MAHADGARRQTVTLLLVFALWAGTIDRTQAAVADYVGRPVVQVRLEAEGVEVREPAVLSLVVTPVGQPLSMLQVRETVGHLFGLGRYEDVQVRASLASNGVNLMYELIPLHRVQALEFRGTLGLDESLLRTTVADRLGPTPPVGRSTDAARILGDLYLDHGYRHPTITPRSVVEHKPDRTTLIFDIDAGRRTRVGMVTVEGAPIPAEALLDRIGLRRAEPFEQTTLVAALGRYRADLQAKGYYEARVNFLPRFAADELTVDVTVIVDIGPLVTVRFEGDPLPQRERADLVPIEREQSVDEDLLEDSKRRIEGRLRDQGYRAATADYRRVETEGTLAVIFTIRRGALHRLANVEIAGNSSVPTVQLRSLVRVKEGQPFVDSIFSADVAGIEELYRRQGFAAVKIETGVSPAGDTGDNERPVAARLTIAEGVQSVVRTVTLTGNRAIRESTLRLVAGLVSGQAFYEPQINVAADGLVIEYLNDGYPDTVIERTVTFSADRRDVDVAFRIQEGVQIVVDHILIVGNTRTASGIIQREIVFKAGEPLGQNAIDESRRRLGALGLFRRIDITQLRHIGEEGRRDVLVTVEEARATTVSWGGGLDGGKRLRRAADGTGPAEERIELGPHGFFQVGRRNLWGRNRSIDLFARVSFRPRGTAAVPTGTPDTTHAGYGFNEHRVTLTYREPKIFSTSADGLFSGGVEQAIRSSFNFSRRGARMEIARRLTTATSLSGRYSLDETHLFNESLIPSERPLIDRLFPQVRLSSFSSSVIRNTRDDPIEPTRGTLVTIDGALAARAAGSQVGFVKTLSKGFFYRQLSGSRRVVLAGGATVGLAEGFPRRVALAGGQTETVKDLPASERFYAGGDTTVRGFALDRLGTPETIDKDGFPKGGHALMIFNGELRVPVWRDLGAVGFIDVGNVFAKIGDVDLGELRAGVGFGVRYRSPVGPIRVDLGFKLSRLDFPGGKEPLTALHISLGQAF